MKKNFLSTFLLIAAAILLSASFAQAGITTTGNVEPADPSTWDSSTDAYIGNTADGTMAINGNSDVVSNYAYLGYEAGATGTVTVDGAGSALTTNSIYGGYYGTGELNVTNGGTISGGNTYLGREVGSSGTATVDGVGSTLNNSSFLYVGRYGTGELSITNGGTVTSSLSYIGQKAGASGTVTVDGAGSTWTNDRDFRVGYDGIGELSITNGGTVTSGGSSVGFRSSGTATVDGIGSTWTATGTFYVGYRSGSVGELNITNGGTVTSNGTCRVGFNSNTSGTVNVDGLGSTWTTGLLELGNGSSSSSIGTLNITNGGVVNSGSARLGDNPGNGIINVDGAGSAWTVNSSIDMGRLGTGVITITNGGTVTSSGTVTMGHYGSGTVTTDGAGSAWTHNGDIQVGNVGTGTINILNSSTATVTGTATFADTSGAVNFGDNGGTLTTGTLKASSDQFTGTGTIFTQGYYGDLDVLIDASHDAPAGEQVATWNGAGQNIAVYLDLSGSNGYVGDFVAGYENTGSLAIMDGRSLSSADGYIGYLNGSNGTALVSGPGSTWIINGTNSVGHAGTGTLNISAGGSVSAGGNTYIGNQSTCAGSMSVRGPGSSYTTANVLNVGHSGEGSLTVSDGASVSAGGNATIGNQSRGTLGIYGAASATAVGDTHIGYAATGAGSVVVKGPGSTYATGGDLNVGYYGEGSLWVTKGGSVSAEGNAIIGNKSGGVGRVVVNGAGSTLTSNGTLVVGSDGTGNLSVSDGGAVSAENLVAVNAQSLMSIEVGKGSSLTVGDGAGSLINQGTIRMTAGAAAASGTYTPISADSWTNAGAIQALGGVWDSTSHTVTVSDAEVALSGRAKNIDLASTQRLLFVDAPTARVVGASFMAAETPTDLTFTADIMGGSELSALESILGSGEDILAGWDFSVSGSGYAGGDPVYLSLEVGSGYDLSVLALWYYDGSTWSEYFANDLTYDNTYAGFTVTGFSGYAVTAGAPVPIPGAVWLLGSGLLGLVGIHRRRK